MREKLINPMSYREALEQIIQNQGLELSKKYQIFLDGIYL